MAKVKIITAYIPIPNHPRTAEEYGKLGEGFRGITAAPVKAFYQQLADLWLGQFVWSQPNKITHSEGDNPAKNTLAYHIVQHNKFAWLTAAAITDPDPDVFVWLDYGIFHQPNVTAKVIDDFVRRVDDKYIYAPGCWPEKPVDDSSPCWRFCGSMFAVPRRFLQPLDNRFREETKRNIWKTKNLSWEVNDLARMEQSYRELPIHWYKGDHDQTQFTNYGAPHAT